MERFLFDTYLEALEFYKENKEDYRANDLYLKIICKEKMK